MLLYQLHIHARMGGFEGRFQGEKQVVRLRDIRIERHRQGLCLCGISSDQHKNREQQYAQSIAQNTPLAFFFH